MPLYFIEMGQGVIARPEMRVRTSCLSSCTMMTGWSATTNFGAWVARPPPPTHRSPAVSQTPASTRQPLSSRSQSSPASTTAP